MDGNDLVQWFTGMRPRLHGFCVRIMGSAIDGEDIVQEALARAAVAYADAAPDRPEAWLFRIARTAAIDALRQKKSGAVDLSDQDDADPQADTSSRARVTLGFTAFLPLRPPQRASVVLVDVLGYSLAETAAILETTVPAIKAALHRGRMRLAAPIESAPVDGQERLRLRAYADLFNAREFDALRDLLAADVRLDLPLRLRLEGKADVSVYFHRYSATDIAWQVEPVLADGRPALLATDSDDPGNHFVVLLGWSDGRIAFIRDFLYARYIMEGIDIVRI